MAIIPLQQRVLPLAALRAEERIERLPPAPQPRGVIGLLVGTAVVAGSVVGLLLYDAGRPIASGAVASPPPLVISVQPSQDPDPQLR